MRILIFVLLLLGTSIQAQNVLTCYDYHDFSETDCVGCGLKDSTFSGILLVKNGTIYQPLVKPIKIKTRPNILDMEDGFATRVSIYIDQITTYNTEASVLAFLRACACGVTVDSTMITEGWGINVTEPTANNYVVGADSFQVATTYDLTLKQDLLNGVAPRIPFFTSATTLGTNANFYWDNTYSEMAIKDRLFGSNATGQLYIGYLAGDAATSATHSNFLSDRAGQLATNATQSNFFGFRSGYQATNASNSNFLGYEAGQQATNAAHSTFMGYKAGRGATDAKYSFFAGDSTGMGATGAEYANFLGYRSGYNASNAYWSNFFGRDAGSGATQAYYSNFIGYKAGSGALLSYGSNFIGYLAGYGSETSEYSNFVGHNAGWSCLLCPNSNYIGKNAGYGAVGASESNFMGFNAGNGATYAYGSNFFGYNAGNSSSAEYSNFFGSWAGMDQNDAAYSTFIGYRSGEGTVGRYLGANNIIIGTNINLPENSSNAMSLGNVLYGTGFKYDPTDADSTQYISPLGKIGVLTATPTQQLHVAGNLRVEGAIYDSNNEPGISGQVLSTTNTGTDWVDMAGGDTTQYLNPYVMGPDTVGFYLTIAQDTVLFLSTIDSTGVADSTSVVGGYGIDVVESPANVWTVGADTSQVATRHDLTLKENVLSFTSPLSRSGNTISIPAATSSIPGHLTAADHTIFSAKVGGSGANTQAAYFTASNTLASNSSFTYASSQWNMIGRFDLRQTATNFSVCIGAGSGNVGTSTGGDNFWLGRDAGRVNTSGHSNFAGGVNALYSNLTGFNNTCIGLNSMFYNTSGSNNLAMGTSALSLNTDGFYNTALSPTALYNNTSGYANVAIGYNSMLSNQTGISNLAAGWRSLYSNVSGGYNVSLGDFSLYNTTGGYNVGLGYYAGGQNTSASNRLYIENSNSETPLIGGDFSGNKVGINTLISSIDQTLDVTGTVRITGSDGTSTTIMGRDGDGDVSAITASSGITLASNTLKADTSVLATQYDLTQVVGSSKVIDILGSDFTTSATSLQSTALAYTFPTTGTYEIRVYGSYTCSNTANGINVGFIDSGGLVASYVTGKHSAFTNNTSSGTTETRKPISAIGTTLSTASVFAASTAYTVISEALITVSTAGTITLGFASGSGSYSATLQAGSS